MSMQTNGQARKSLASQLDRHEEVMGRLEGTIDALADGLNQAVATCVEESVTAAVQLAVVEVLSNRLLQQRMRDELKADKPANPVVQGVKRLWGWVKSGVGNICRKVVSLARTVCGTVVKALATCKEVACSKVANAVQKTKAVVSYLKPSRTLVLAAVAAGMALAVGPYWCSPVISSLLSGVAGFFAALAAGAMKVVRGLVGGEKVAST